MGNLLYHLFTPLTPCCPWGSGTLRQGHGIRGQKWGALSLEGLGLGGGSECSGDHPHSCPQNSQEQPEASCSSKTLCRGGVASGKEVTLLQATCQGVVPSETGAAVTSPCFLHIVPHPPTPCPLAAPCPPGPSRGGWGCGCSGTAGSPSSSPSFLGAARGDVRVSSARGPDPEPHRLAAPLPRDTQEPITGLRGRAAAPWVRRGAGYSCLRGSGLTRGAGAAGGLTDARAGGRGRRRGWGSALLSSASTPSCRPSRHRRLGRSPAPASTAGGGGPPGTCLPKPRARSRARVPAPSQPRPPSTPVAAARARGGGSWGGGLRGHRREGGFPAFGTQNTECRMFI